MPAMHACYRYVLLHPILYVMPAKHASTFGTPSEFDHCAFTEKRDTKGFGRSPEKPQGYLSCGVKDLHF